ncbi:hypothetical protein M1N24_00075 [Dehalococcoidia bacterium]|nr:hypothetical protein [Dehalococcoidia bacterium]
MSKILDRLDQITRGVSRALGFTTSASRDFIPSMALLASAELFTKNNITSMSKANVDALILNVRAPKANVIDRHSKLLEGHTWGVAVESLEQPHVEIYQGKGCDFLVFGIDNTPVDVLEDGACARILRVPTTLEDSLIRGLEDLPVDIVLICKPAPDGPLNLTHLLSISNVRSSTSRYVLLEWNSELTSRELEHLRDIGVDGLVIDVSNNKHSLIAVLRDKIDALPKRKSKGEQGSAAMLPRIPGIESSRHRRQDDEEEEEEGEWDEP